MQQPCTMSAVPQVHTQRLRWLSPRLPYSPQGRPGHVSSPDSFAMSEYHRDLGVETKKQGALEFNAWKEFMHETLCWFTICAACTPETWEISTNLLEPTPLRICSLQMGSPAHESSALNARLILLFWLTGNRLPGSLFPFKGKTHVSILFPADCC